MAARAGRAEFIAKDATQVFIEARRPSSPFPAYRDWHRSPIEPMDPLAAATNLSQRGPSRDWEYRLVPVPAPKPYVPPAPVVPEARYTIQMGGRHTSVRPELEAMHTDHVELLAKEATAEAKRRENQRAEAAESVAREKKALWMRVHGEKAREGFSNFMTGVVQAIASKSVLRWSKGHQPYGGTNPTSGGDWTDEEVYAAEQACYARGHVPPWHIDGAQCADRQFRTPAAMGVYRSS